jgi:hypothetical protein
MRHELKGTDMTVLYVVYDSNELSAKTKEFLDLSGYLSEPEEDGGYYYLTEPEVVSMLDRADPMAGESWWDKSGFSSDQRSTLEILWRLNPDAEARWETP